MVNIIYYLATTWEEGVYDQLNYIRDTLERRAGERAERITLRDVYIR